MSLFVCLFAPVPVPFGPSFGPLSVLYLLASHRPFCSLRPALSPFPSETDLSTHPSRLRDSLLVRLWDSGSRSLFACSRSGVPAFCTFPITFSFSAILQCAIYKNLGPPPRRRRVGFPSPQERWSENGRKRDIITKSSSMGMCYCSRGWNGLGRSLARSLRLRSQPNPS